VAVAIDSATQQQGLIDDNLLAGLQRFCVATLGVTGRVVQTPEFSQSAGIVDEQHRGNALIGSIDAADINRAAIHFFGVDRAPKLD
jgi:hypothetical protein